MTMGIPGGQPDFLAQINSTLTGAPQPGAGPVMLGAPPPPAPPMLPGGAPLGPPPPGPNMSPMPPPAPAPMNHASTPPPPVAPNPAPAPQGPSPFLQRVHGAMTSVQPAHEVEMRGPQLKGAQAQRNVAFEGAIQAVNERGQETAAEDYALALEEQRKAGIREDAANYSAAERANELAERQADFDTSTKALSQASVDPNRFWSNANAGTVIASLISVALGGFIQGKTGRSNVGMDTVNQMIDRDIKAQEFAYNATRDTANAKQTAYSMAMQKYQNVDAARAAARAAALDVAVGIANQKAALSKGTEYANRASMAAAELSADRANQIAQGVQFVPARAVSQGAQYIDPRTGMTYSEAEAKGLVAKMDEREFKREEKGLDVAGQVIVEGAKSGAKANEKSDEGAKFVSTQLQQAGVPQARSAAESALAALNANPGGKIEALDRAVMPDAISHSVHSHEANAREQAYSKFSNAAVKAIMGNATEAERARMTEDLGRASDPESRRRAIALVLKDLDAIEKNARAGATPAAQADYSDRRRKAEAGDPVAPKGSKAGW